MNSVETQNLKFVEFNTNSGFYMRACQLRNRVLRQPLGLNLFHEDLSQECDYRHFAVLDGNQLIACLLIVPLSITVVVLRQMCVDENYRGMRIGYQLVGYVEEALTSSNVEKIELAARLPAMPFYKKLGFSAIGPEFESVGIPHQKMFKELC